MENRGGPKYKCCGGAHRLRGEVGGGPRALEEEGGHGNATWDLRLHAQQAVQVVADLQSRLYCHHIGKAAPAARQAGLLHQRRRLRTCTSPAA